MAGADFVHLHLHTLYSLLDGAIRMPDLVETVRAKGMRAVAVTDHGNLFGAIDFYKRAKDAGIKPIFGCEAYVAGPKGRKDRTERVAHHLVLLAKNEEGWRNLRYLVSMGYLEGHYYHPRIDKELLAKHSRGLYGLTACLGGEVTSLARQGDMDGARRAALEYKEIFEPGHFFLEIQSNGMPDQVAANERIKELSRDLDIPLVATADAHYVRREDAKAHELLMCIAQGCTYDDPKRMRQETSELYIKSPEEMLAYFSDVPEAVWNTVRIAENCNVELELGKVHLPQFQVPEGFDNDSYLAHLARTGLDQRFKELEGRYPIDKDEYRKRLELEIEVIQRMGFSGYFLIVQDFINWAKQNGIPVGPGRGSGAGSLVAYALRITDIDPIPYGLLFERFLNPERVSMPDFDVDFCQTRREKVIDYVTRKYGELNVGQIITFGQLSAKSAIKDVARVLGLSFSESNELTKNIPNLIDGKPATIEKALEIDPRLRERVESDPKIREVVEIARALEGLNRQAGMHAAGVVIADKPLWEYVPVYQPAGEKVLVTQFAKDEVEAAGLVKFDFLGLKTLTVIDNAIRMINENHPEANLTPNRIPLDDPATYQMISRGDTQGVFQLESSGFTELLRKLKPDCFEDIVAAVALYRPGPLGSGMIDDFIDRKHGRQKVTYPHPDLEPILRPTYGVIVYQEQVMQIAQVMGGYSLGRADLLRRAMGKKKPEVMQKERAGFIEGAKARGIDEKLAGEIFDLMEKFAAYGFNKCVVGDTRVVDAATGRRMTVRELFERGGGIETLSLDEKEGRIVARKVTDVVENGVKPVFELRTALGKRIVATGNHPFLTPSGWKWLQDLRPGEAIATPAVLPLEKGRHWPRHQIVALAALLSAPPAEDGSGFVLEFESEALAEDFAYAARCFAYSAVERYGLGVRIRCPAAFARESAIGGATAARLQPAEECGFVAWARALGVGNGGRRIPEEVFTLADGDLELLLGRLWSARGTLSATPRLLVDSEEMALDVQHLLCRLGIVAAVRPVQHGYKVRVLGGANLERFYHRIVPHVLGRNEERRALSAHILARPREREESAQIHWDEVVAIEPRGEQMTYDLTVDETHNFVADGIVVHNSHSAAYAVITMQTAWLKCHYPAEFMAALLTSDADRTDKLVAHIADAKARGIEVLPPDINASAYSFHGKGSTIRFGLSGIKGVGDSAIEAILEARKEGPFLGLFDFCERVDLRRVNRKVIECLVRCGAFDSVGVPRWVLFASIDKALERGQAAQRDRAIGQASLFGLLGGGGGSGSSAEPGKDGPYVECEPWTEKEMLAGEKETLGFYVTGHPLDPYAEEIRRYATCDIATLLSRGKAGETVRIVGVPSALRTRPTKSGRLMGFATLEDLTGSIEVICFSGPRRAAPGREGEPRREGGFEVWQPLLEGDEPLLVTGTVQINGRDEENPVAELIADDIVPLAEVRAQTASRLTLRLEAGQVSEERLARARKLLESHPGHLPVEVMIRLPEGTVARLRLRDHRVAPSDELRDRLNLLFQGPVVEVR